MKTIPLTKGYEAIVDDEDYPDLIQFPWHACVCPRTVYAKYSHYNPNRRPAITIRLHRHIMKAPPGVWVDHIDGNGLNNQRSNLRLATAATNAQNKPKAPGCLSPYIGVTRRERVTGIKGGRPFRAVYSVGRTLVRIGHFATAEEAARAYDDAVLRIHGKHAKVNFPEEPKE